MPYKVKAYWDSWQSNYPITLIIPKSSEYDYDTLTNSEYDESGLKYADAIEVTGNHSMDWLLCNNITDPNTGNSILGYMAATLYFENVIPMSSYFQADQYRDIYISATSKFHIKWRSGGTAFQGYTYINEQSKNGGWDAQMDSYPARTFPSIPDDDHQYTCYFEIYDGGRRDGKVRQIMVGKTNNSTQISNLKDFYYGIEIMDPTDDPYFPGYDPDPDDPDGGDGNYDDTSDDVFDPGILQDLEDHSAVASGLIRVYSPDASELQSLGTYLWSSTFDPTTIKKLFNDGFGAILGLSVIPVEPTKAGSKNHIILGDQDSGVDAYPVTAQYVSHDFGSLAIAEYWGCYLDYNPYTTMELYLPYSGFVPIDPDDYMGTTMKIRYTIDVLSGEFLAILTARDLVINQILGSCAQQVPLTSSDHAQYLQNWLNATLSGIQTLAAINGSTWTSSDTVSESLNKEGWKGSSTLSQSESHNLGAELGAAGSSAKSIMSMKERYKHSGGVAGASGHMGVRYPYVIYRRARQSAPVGGNAFTGYPSNKTAMLSSLSGFTSVSAVNFIAPSASLEESAEIVALLKSGVIL